MGLLCGLYGHQWRHPGAYEIIVAEDGRSSHRLECAVCGNELLAVETGDRA